MSCTHFTGKAAESWCQSKERLGCLQPPSWFILFLPQDRRAEEFQTLNRGQIQHPKPQEQSPRRSGLCPLHPRG